MAVPLTPLPVLPSSLPPSPVHMHAWQCPPPPAGAALLAATVVCAPACMAVRRRRRALAVQGCWRRRACAAESASQGREGGPGARCVPDRAPAQTQESMHACMHACTYACAANSHACMNACTRA
eukprot:299323-Chlamydomonas_euryale.AAC.2